MTLDLQCYQYMPFTQYDLCFCSSMCVRERRLPILQNPASISANLNMQKHPQTESLIGYKSTIYRAYGRHEDWYNFSGHLLYCNIEHFCVICQKITYSTFNEGLRGAKWAVMRAFESKCESLCQLTLNIDYHYQNLITPLSPAANSHCSAENKKTQHKAHDEALLQHDTLMASRLNKDNHKNCLPSLHGRSDRERKIMKLHQ